MKYPFLIPFWQMLRDFAVSPMAMLLLTNDEQTRMFLAASFGQRLRLLSHGDDWEMEPDFPVVKAIRSGRAIQTDDLAASEFYLKGHPTTVSLVEGEGLRTRLSVPLVKDGHGIGCIILCRREVAPFTEADIELVETFASQAVIAIENVRQFKALETLNNELSDRVEKQSGRDRTHGPVETVLAGGRCRQSCDSGLRRPAGKPPSPVGGIVLRHQGVHRVLRNRRA